MSGMAFVPKIVIARMIKALEVSLGQHGGLEEGQYSSIMPASNSTCVCCDEVKELNVVAAVVFNLKDKSRHIIRPGDGAVCRAVAYQVCQDCYDKVSQEEGIETITRVENKLHDLLTERNADSVPVTKIEDIISLAKTPNDSFGLMN